MNIEDCQIPSSAETAAEQRICGFSDNLAN